MTARIPLTQGLVALVDDTDEATALAAGKWSSSVKPTTTYALRGARTPDGRTTTIRLHNYLTGLTFVDHINGDGLDNRRSNLRAATKVQNGQNSRLNAASSSGLKGVTWHKGARKWAAQITCDRRRIYLGLFVDPVEAALAYDAAARDLFADFARPNYPSRVSA